MTYDVEVRRVDAWWAIDVKGLRGGHTQAKRLDQVEAMARDLIAVLTDARPRDIQIHLLQPQLGPGLTGLIADTLTAREAAEEHNARAASTTLKAIARLQGAGLSSRDIGTLVGLSHQRVAQLTKREERSAGSVPTADAGTPPGQMAAQGH